MRTPRDAVERFVALMVDDPSRGRCCCGPGGGTGSPLGANGCRLHDLFQRKLTRITDPAVQAMVATGLIGAFTALFTAYLKVAYGDTGAVHRYCVEMLLSRVSSY